MQKHESEREPADRDDVPDPWDGEHSIEYWVWHGARLVPATPEERARIQEEERTRAAGRLTHLREREQHTTRRKIVQWLRRRRHPRQTSRTEGAHAERSSTKS